MKIKPILPSLREKKRYLAFEVISKSRINSFNDVSESINQNCRQFIGDLGMSQAGILILEDKWNPQLQKGILKVSHKSVDRIKASLSLIKNIKEEEVIIRSVGLSGILKKAQNKYMAS